MVFTNKKNLSCPNCMGVVGVAEQELKESVILTYNFSNETAEDLNRQSDYFGIRGVNAEDILKESVFKCKTCGTDMVEGKPNPLKIKDLCKELLSGEGEESKLYGLKEENINVETREYQRLINDFASKNKVRIIKLHFNEENLVVLITQTDLAKTKELIKKISKNSVMSYVYIEEKYTFKTNIYKCTLKKKFFQLLKALER